MTSIIKSILCELHFEPGPSFITYKNDMPLTIFPFYEKNNKGQIIQVYLVFPSLESQLLELDVMEVFPYIAESFRKTDTYPPDMDKNISLLFCIQRDLQSEKMKDMQVAIEDDPYFFKKYVFGYLDSEPAIFEQLKTENGTYTYVEFIQAYILNREHFQRFKENAKNETMYRFVSDLLIKIPVMPMEFHTREELRTVDNYFSNETVAAIAPNLDAMIAVLNDDSKEPLEAVDILIAMASALGDK